MTLEIGTDLQQQIAERIESGLYESVDHVVREALQALAVVEDHQSRLHELRREVQKGLDDLEAGRVVTMTQELLDTMKHGGRERLLERANAMRGEPAHA